MSPDFRGAVQPPQLMGMRPTFGFGDRLGLATLGHLDAIRSQGGPILPIFAQQSMRELLRTDRKPADVINDAMTGLTTGRYTEAWGADADHLKTQEDLNATASAGFTYFTIDPTEHIDINAQEYSDDELAALYRSIRSDVNWSEKYVGSVIEIPNGPTLSCERKTIMELAVKFGRAISHAIKMAAHIDRVMTKRNAEYEIEVCLDESLTPTTYLEHYIVAQQCMEAGMKMVALAPRFEGQFEPGIDFGGDVKSLKRCLQSHAAIATALGNYKLSLHSGSDKFSIYKMFAQVTQGRFHVKTSGSSYLEALRVAARRDRKLFRRIIEFSRKRFEQDRDTYYISAKLKNAPTPAAISDDEKLESIYLDQADGRQILHVTFGSILTESALGPALRDLLQSEPNLHREVISLHFAKHLQALNKGLKGVTLP